MGGHNDFFFAAKHRNGTRRHASTLGRFFVFLTRAGRRFVKPASLLACLAIASILTSGSHSYAASATPGLARTEAFGDSSADWNPKRRNMDHIGRLGSIQYGWSVSACELRYGVRYVICSERHGLGRYDLAYSRQ